MKYLLSAFICLTALIGCAHDPKTAGGPAADMGQPDSVAIAASLHGFYKWYAETGDQLMSTYNFIDASGKHPKLKEEVLDQYFSEFLKSGYVSADLVAEEKRFYQACAEAWKNEDSGGRYTGFDFDRYYCQNDGDIKEFQTAGIRFKMRGDRAKVMLNLDPKGPNGGPRGFEMKKEGGKWLLSRLNCNAGVLF